MIGTTNDAKSARLREVRAWARELFAVAQSETILVTELACGEPGCPPSETVIAVLTGPGRSRQYKIPRPVTTVTRDEVAALAQEHARVKP
jgi:hypothetical protein